MLARGGYRLIEKDEAYFAGKLRKQLLLEAGQDGIPRCARWGDERLVAADRAVPGCLVLQMREEIAVAIDVWTLVSAPLARSPVVCVRLCPSLECLFCVAQEGNHLVQGDIGPWLGDSPGLDGGSGVGGGRGRPVAHTRGGREGGRSGGSARGGGAAGQGTEGKQGGHGRLSGGKAGGIGDMPGTEGVAAGKGGGAAERQVAEGTEQRSAQLGMGRTPNHSLRGLGLFVWRRPALHPGERKGRTHLERERLAEKPCRSSPHVLPLRHHTSFPLAPMAPPRHSYTAAAVPSPSRLLLPRLGPAPHPLARNAALEWIGLPLAFDVVHDELQVNGYQMYAVEKWSVRLFSIHPKALPFAPGSSNAIAPSPSSASTPAIRPTRSVHPAPKSVPHLHLRSDNRCRPRPLRIPLRQGRSCPLAASTPPSPS